MTAKRILTWLLLIFFLPAGGSAQPRQSRMKYKPEKFSRVPLDTRISCECSPPEQAISWRGILLQVPEELELEAGDQAPALPVCGLYNMELSRLSDGRPLQFIVVRRDPGGDRGKDVLYRGPFVEEDPSPEEPPPAHTAPDTKGMATGAYFNADVLRYVSMPLTPGQYEVYAEYGGLYSNKSLLRVKPATP